MAGAGRDVRLRLAARVPRDTGRDDMAENSEEQNASHRVASFFAGMTGQADAWQMSSSRALP